MDTRKVQEPLSLRKHGDLQNTINEMIIAIKIHHIDLGIGMEEGGLLEKAKESHPCPTWEQLVDILHKSYHALDEQRYNPVKY